jgi:hypothetical protein
LKEAVNIPELPKLGVVTTVAAVGYVRHVPLPPVPPLLGVVGLEEPEELPEQANPTAVPATTDVRTVNRSPTSVIPFRLDQRGAPRDVGRGDAAGASLPIADEPKTGAMTHTSINEARMPRVVLDRIPIRFSRVAGYTIEGPPGGTGPVSVPRIRYSLIILSLAHVY